MDETPVYTDMVSDRTMEFIQVKNVDGATTCHGKSRFTVVLTVSIAGKMLKAYVIFKGLKNVPKCPVPSNIILNVAKGGSVKEDLMLDYCRRVLTVRDLFLCIEDSLLFMDKYGSYTHDSVTKQLNSMKIKVKLIPEKNNKLFATIRHRCKWAF